MTYKEKYAIWLSNTENDQAIHDQLVKIQNDDNQIKECFSSDLVFGTGGLRGILGAGTARMNIYTVGRATQGLADHINEGDNKSVVIAYDSRRFSPEFAKTAAGILSANGIKVYLFESLRPTPELSFAVRYLKCASGIVITASHNPAEYNGYKVYGSDGGQLSGDLADKVQSLMNSIDIFDGVKTPDFSLVKTIGKEVDEAYYESVLSQRICPSVSQKASDMKIVYTPFHGAGNIPVRNVLSRAGYNGVTVVSAQELPDGDFPTVKSPNPENPEGFALAVKLADDIGANLIIGTDPDSDRVGVLVRKSDGEFLPLTGNQTGALLTEYILSARKEENRLPKNGAVIKTVVTTEMIRAITNAYGVALDDVLTGFKYIAGKIAEYEQTKQKTYLFGFEESYGYLPGTSVRDKDGVAASLLIVEMAAKYSLSGKTLYDGLCDLYKKYGYYKEWNKSIYMEGIDGAAKISAVMESLRKDLPSSFGGKKIVAYTDYEASLRYDIRNNTQTKINLPVSNVLRFETEDGGFIAFRPSGTEPKLKIYVGVCGDNADQKISDIEKDISSLMNN